MGKGENDGFWEWKPKNLSSIKISFASLIPGEIYPEQKLASQRPDFFDSVQGAVTGTQLVP